MSGTKKVARFTSPCQYYLPQGQQNGLCRDHPRKKSRAIEANKSKGRWVSQRELTEFSPSRVESEIRTGFLHDFQLHLFRCKEGSLQAPDRAVCEGYWSMYQDFYDPKDLYTKDLIQEIHTLYNKQCTMFTCNERLNRAPVGKLKYVEKGLCSACLFCPSDIRVAISQPPRGRQDVSKAKSSQTQKISPTGSQSYRSTLPHLFNIIKRSLLFFDETKFVKQCKWPFNFEPGPFTTSTAGIN